ncbi:MAG: glutathione S-transferase [Beijerinckiaceae bacterium]
MDATKIVLHGTALSGHAHRIELLLRMLGLPYLFSASPADVRRTPEFQKLNPLGQIPVLEDGPVVIADSNAIMTYLVHRYDPKGQWLSRDPVIAAEIQRWLSIAAGEIFYGPATARMVAQWGMQGDAVRALVIAQRLFSFMDQHLSGRSFLAAEHATLADLACYSYTAHAPEGGISLERYPAIRAWIARVEALPNFKPMPQSPLPTGLTS